MREIKRSGKRKIYIKWTILFALIVMLYFICLMFVKFSYEKQIFEFIQPVMQDAGYELSGEKFLWESLVYTGTVIFVIVSFLLCVSGIFFERYLLKKDIERLERIIEEEKKTVYEMLRVEKECARNERERMGKYMENLSHQLKTPIAGTLLALEYLYDTEEDSEKKGRLNKCINQLDWIKEILMVLLRLAQIDSGKIWMKRKRENLGELLEHCVQRVRELSDEKQIHIIVNAERNCMLSCDAFWIKEAIENVLKNAIEYTPKDGEIRISLQQTEQKYDVRIHNSGEALKKEIKDRIFDRFYQMEHNRNSKDGVGIGLNLSKEITKLHQGTLCVMDTQETGTTFQFIFPKLIAKESISDSLTIS